MIKRLFLLLFITCLAACQQDTTTALSRDSKDTPLNQDRYLHSGKLENGLRYFILPNAYPKDRVYIRLVVNAGSMNEDDDQKGVAHIVEHMAFNGSQQYPQNSIINALEKLGMKFARDINAFTDFENTVYTLNLAKTDKQTMDLAFNILNEWMNHLTMLPADLDAERGIVLEEWRARLSPMLRLGDQKSAVELAGSRYAKRDPIGDVDVIKHISAKRVNDFYQKWYRPDNMAIVVAGDISSSQIESLLREKFSAKSDRALSPLEKIDYRIPLHQGWKLASVAEPTIYTAALEFSILQDLQVKNTQSEYEEGLIAQIMTRLLNTRLQRWEKQQADTVQSATFYQSSLGRETQQTLFSLQLSEPNYQNALTQLFQFIAEIKQHGFSQDEFQSAIDYSIQLNEKQKDIQLGSLKLADDLVTNAATNQIFMGKDQKYQLNKAFLKKMTLSDVNQAFAELISQPTKLVLITQPKRVQPLPFNQQDVEKNWAKQMQTAQQNWAEEKANASLPTLQLTDGKILNRQHWKQENITRYQLSNGSQVIYHQTDKTPDQVYFKAVTSGGLRSVPKADYHWLRAATTLVDETGIGALSQESFAQLFSDKPVVLATLIDDYQQGFAGAGKTVYLEDILQLFRFKLASAPVSETVLKNYKTENQRYFNQLDVGEKFSRQVSQARYPNTPTNYSLDAKTLQQFTAAQLSAIYQKYLLDKTDFTYYLVGDLPQDKAEQLIKKYLANVEVKTQQRHIQPAKAQIPAHPLYLKGLPEPRAEVSLYFNADYPWNVENNTLLDILGDIVQEQLRLELREKESGIYSVTSWFSQDKYANQLEARIEFSCAPERVQELTQQAHGIFAQLVQNGVPEALLQKKISEKQRELKQESELTLSVLERLMQSFSEKDNPDLLYMEQYLPVLASKENLNNLARTLLTQPNYFQAVLMQ